MLKEVGLLENVRTIKSIGDPESDDFLQEENTLQCKYRRLEAEERESYISSLNELLSPSEGIMIASTCHCQGHANRHHEALDDLTLYRKCLAELCPPHMNQEETNRRYSECSLSNMRTNAQVEFKAKVRVSSLHDAAATNVARNLTSKLARVSRCLREIQTRDHSGLVL